MDNISVEQTEYLGNGVRAVISKSHGFGTDAVLLASFASPKKNEKACDLGTGCGIIPLLWLRNGCASSVTGVDVQPLAVEQAQKGAALSENAEKLSFVCGDLKEIKTLLPHASMNVVTMNPPYKADGAGIRSTEKADVIARHETMCSLDDICAAAAHLLNFGGRFCICNRPERLSDSIVAMKTAGIEPKRLRFVSKKADTAPWLFLLEGKKGSKPFMTVEPLLAMYGEDGEYTAEVMNIYGEYKENAANG